MTQINKRQIPKGDSSIIVHKRPRLDSLFFYLRPILRGIMVVGIRYGLPNYPRAAHPSVAVIKLSLTHRTESELMKISGRISPIYSQVSGAFLLAGRRASGSTPLIENFHRRCEKCDDLSRHAAVFCPGTYLRQLKCEKARRR